jgi:Cdc6-like AAA superfamily ATPase
MAVSPSNNKETSSNTESNNNKEKMNPLLGGYAIYKNSLCQFINELDSSFTIGVYGKWGQGKTTLMECVFEEFKSKEKYPNIISVWFNPWRYERENNFAIIPLLLEISNNLPNEAKSRKKYLKLVCLGVVKTLIAITPQIATIADPNLDTNVNLLLKTLSEKTNSNIEEFTGSAEEKSEDLIYGSLFSDLEKAVKGVGSKIVVFVDDLDRCSRKKVLEVFESVKIFLGMENFVFVIGIDHSELQTIIEEEYKKDGEDYLNTIIQMPVFLPEWKSEGIKSIIKGTLSKKLKNETLDKDAIDIISKVEKNPGKAKRLINSLLYYSYLYGHSALYSKDPTDKQVDTSISSSDTHKKEANTNAKTDYIKMMLFIQILSYKWNDFYQAVLRLDNSRRTEILKRFDSVNLEEISNNNVIKKDLENLFNYLESKHAKRLVRKFRVESSLFEFLKYNKNIINNDTLFNDILKKFSDKMDDSDQNSMLIPEFNPKLRNFFKDNETTDSKNSKPPKSTISRIVEGIKGKFHFLERFRRKKSTQSK